MMQLLPRWRMTQLPQVRCRVPRRCLPLLLRVGALLVVVVVKLLLVDLSLPLAWRAEIRPTSWRAGNETYVVEESRDNRSARQQVLRWERVKIAMGTGSAGGNVTVAPPRSDVSNVTQAPWEELKGMVLDRATQSSNALVYYRRRDHRVNQFDFPFRLVPRALCTNRTHVVALVHSRADFADVRQALRDTWLGAAARGEWPAYTGTPLPELRFAFMVAEYGNASVRTALAREAALHNDIVLCGFRDSYYNMTIKSVMGLRYVMEQCPQARYLLKTDDDVIVNWPHLLTALRSQPPQRLMFGPVNPASKVGRDWGKWAVPRSVFPFPKYPPYLSGAAYVISFDLVPLLVAYAPFVPAFHVDDAYITGVLAKVIGVKPKGKKGFAYWGTARPTVCSLVRNKIITGTKVVGEYRAELWKQMLDLNVRRQCT